MGFYLAALFKIRLIQFMSIIKITVMQLPSIINNTLQKNKLAKQTNFHVNDILIKSSLTFISNKNAIIKNQFKLKQTKSLKC